MTIKLHDFVFVVNVAEDSLQIFIIFSYKRRYIQVKDYNRGGLK